METDSMALQLPHEEGVFLGVFYGLERHSPK